MFSFNHWKKIWEKWNIRGVILFSLCLQIFLIVSASSRKRTKSFVVWFVWLFYLLADWAASFCVGLISKKHDSKSTTTRSDYIMAFWAPFLLLHLGGPDTITAFSLEDNELWLRHLLGLIFQSVAAAYVFFLTVPENTLWLPTLLLFLAGLIKYAERTRALYLAGINTFRRSLVPDPDPGPNYAKLMEEHSSRKQAGLPTQIIMIPELVQGSDEAAHEEKNQEGVKEQINDLEAVQKAYFFFQTFKGLIVDMIYSFSDRHQSRQYFKSKTAEEALRVIEIELNFMYEVFYTKASVVRHWFWYLCRFVSFISVVTALVLFISVEKHDFNKFDVKVTYALLYGALALDTMAFFMLIFTDYTATLSDDSQKDSYRASRFQKFTVSAFKHFNEKFLVRFLRLRRPSWKKFEKGPYKDCHQLSASLLHRRWSGSISGYNLLKYCLDQSVSKVPNLNPRFKIARVIQLVCFRIVLSVKAGFYDAVKYLGAKDLLVQWNYKANNPFLKELWEYIFKELKEKSDDVEDVETIQSICSARGEWVLQKVELEPENRENLKPFVEPNEVAFDQSLLLWHVATHLCYALDATGDGGDGHKREFSMLLSDYMLYLLVMQPTLMSAVAGIGQIRLQDTCAEAENFFSKRSLEQRDRKEMQKQAWAEKFFNKRNLEQRDWREMEKKACEILFGVPTEHKPIDVKGDRSKSLLFDACRLAKELNKLKDKKWEIITPVWVELLSYAACHCRPTAHVQLLSKGGELISFVWLLMIQLGLGRQYQIKEGHARAKLIVGKLLNPPT